MYNILCNVFVKLCIDYYQKVYEVGKMKKNQIYYGKPPESIIISFGSSQNYNDWKPLVLKEAVFRYSSQGLQSVPLDTVPDYTENGMYFKEAYAELCYQKNGIAIMMVQFGKRYARCYRYNIIIYENKIIDENKVQLINEKLLWIS